MEKAILEQYQLRTLDPTSWTQDTVHYDSSNPEADDNQGYVHLLHQVTLDHDVAHTPGLSDPIDPLNPSRSIKQVLNQRGMKDLTVEELLKLSVASKSFNSKVFLKLIHKDDSFQELVDSLNLLDKSIEDQNGQLKSLIEVEYLRYVRSKTALDDVLTQFQAKGFNMSDDRKRGNGLDELKHAINDASKESALLVKPIMTSKRREARLKKSIEFIEKKRLFFDLPKKLKAYLQENDYDNFIHDYKKAKTLREGDTDNGENNQVLNRIWEQVDLIIESYKKQLWGQLNSDYFNDDFLKIIRRLLELDEIDNPILEWIEFRFNKLRTRFIDLLNKYHDKMLNIQLNIMSTVDQQDYTTFKGVLAGNVQVVDYTIVVEMWLTINKLFDRLDSLIQQFVEFWNHIEKLISGSYNEQLLSSYVSESARFLNLQDHEVQDIRAKGEMFIDRIVHRIIRFYTSTQDSLKFLTNSSHDSHKQQKGDFITNGDIQDFGFLPPFTNSLSTFRYLPVISQLTFKILSDLGQLTITDKITTELRDTSELITERVVAGVCASWKTDCMNLYKLEDWTRLPTGETILPNVIHDYQIYIIDKLDELLLKRLPTENIDVSIVRYPSKKLLSGIQVQFLRSFDYSVESMIKRVIQEISDATLPTSVKNNHRLLTFFNFRKFTEKIPSIVAKYDAAFETHLQAEKLEIYSVIGDLEVTIFDSYMNEQKRVISSILSKSIKAINWADSYSKANKVSRYMYEATNVLIGVYIGVLSVSSELIERVFHHLLEHTSTVLLQSYREITSFNDAGFKQVVLDIEFFQSLIGKSANNTIKNNFKLVYKGFQGMQLDITGAYEAIGSALDDALQASSIEFEIFNS